MLDFNAPSGRAREEIYFTGGHSPALVYKNCKLCPRNCEVNRLAGETGFCGETAALRIGHAGIHKGEEPPLVGEGGSGTIFVCGCNLGCSFCQNWQISHHNHLHIQPSVGQLAKQGGETLGRELCPREFSKICAALKDKGAININIVTGSHAIPSIIEGLIAAEKEGIVCEAGTELKDGSRLPVVWNSSGYESTEALSLLEDYVDIYLPDLKTLDSAIAARYFNAPDYPETAAAAILKMIEMKSDRPEKVIIRHLILPGYLDSTRSVLRWFAANARGKAQLSLLTQYTPIPNRNHNGIARPMPDRYLTKEEYDAVLGWLDELGIEDGYCQELVTGNEWLPDFKRANPFSSELSIPVLF